MQLDRQKKNDQKNMCTKIIVIGQDFDPIVRYPRLDGHKIGHK